MKIALGVEYCGSQFFGWQIQTQARSVQGCLEMALTKVANHPVTVICAGRTDTGVHAIGQVIHIDVTAQRSPRSWILGTNSNLPHDISILWAQEVDDSFHARFSATARHYRYIILNRFTRPAVLSQRVTWYYQPLDVERMQLAANDLIGTHDFTSYRALNCQAKNPVRTISQLNIFRQEDLIIIDISANAFLYHMVRNIAGVLMAIGSGKQPTSWAQTVLAARDRTAGGITAPASGLYFCQVDYPSPYIFPKAGKDSLLPKSLGNHSS
jgi:tRNA pseudouridine38-40 synthase